VRLGPKRVLGGVGAMSAVLAMSLRFGLGCGGSDEPLLLGAGLGGAPPHAASASVGSNVSTAISTGALTWPDDKTREAPCAPNSPLKVPYGWTEYRDWSCKCPFYVPSSKDVLPDPIQWKPCTALPAGIDCRVMDTNWNDSDSPIALHYLNFSHNPDGSAVLGFVRGTRTSGLEIIADADGPVRFALLSLVSEENQPGCYLLTNAVNEGKFLFSLHGDDVDGKQSTDEGSIGGSIDDLKPTVLTRGERKGPFIFGWAAGAKWIMRLSDGFRLHVLSWDDPSKEIFVTSPAVDPDGEAAAQPLVRGDAVFWNTTSLNQNGINVWTKEGGTRPFIRWVGEYTKGADALGTDGVDMVWAYGEGKRWNKTVYPRRSVMTSPFTTDPKKLKPRRLRAHPYDRIGNARFVVGCGYAAHKMLDQNGVATMVIRLSDGHAWTIPRAPEFTHYEPLGVTCEDVFIKGEIEGRSNIARIRLDSLGPGLPPD
jgi:hypothetical protein